MCDPSIAWDDRKADQKPGNTSSYNDTGAESYKAQKISSGMIRTLL